MSEDIPLLSHIPVHGVYSDNFTFTTPYPPSSDHLSSSYYFLICFIYPSHFSFHFLFWYFCPTFLLSVLCTILTLSPLSRNCAFKNLVIFCLKIDMTWWIAWTRAISKGKRRPETPRRKLDDNIKMDMLKHGYETFIIVWCLWIRASSYNSQRKSNKMQQCIKNLFNIYMKFNMFRATHRPSSGA
jgi:hypothetical protein